MNEFVSGADYNIKENYNLFLLVDMDYFYVACEIRRNKSLEGKPVAVFHAVGERGAILTSNYEARKMGIKSGMSLSKARSVPGVIFINADMDYYLKTSNEIFSFLKGFGELEQVSVDEGFILIKGNYEKAYELAESIKQNIKEKFDLPCSIGISYNRVMAKLACEFAKPNGIFVIRRSEAQEFLKDVEVSKLYGVGEKTTKILNSLGVYKVKDLFSIDPSLLRSKLGDKASSYLFLLAKGEDPYKYNKEEIPKSISTINTLEKDLDKEEILEIVFSMVYELSSELQTNNLVSKTVTVRAVYEDFDNQSVSFSLNFYTNDYKKLFEVAKQLVNKLDNKKIRKIGVGFSNLKKLTEESLKNY
ncbi:MAG: DNA polymerase IV [Candidatus Parvarchaeota archaeon]|nr:DNA polymerase IV [Candidatus Rehaiarchaeum fermentans]